MKSFGFTIKNSIFGRLLFTFMVIMIPIYFIGINIYNWGVNTVRREISYSMSTQVSFLLNNLEKEIQRIRILQYNCINDEDLTQIAGTPNSLNNYEKIKVMLRLQQRLYSIKNSSIYIDDVIVYIPSVKKSVSAVGGIGVLPEEHFNMLVSLPPTADSQISYFNGCPFLRVVYPTLFQGLEKEPMFVIEVGLSNAALRNALNQYNIDNGGIILTNRENDYEVRGTENEASGIYKSIVESIYKKYAKDKNGIISLKIGENKYLAIYSYSELLNFHLTKFIPEEDIFMPLRKYEIWFWVFSLMSLVIILIFSTSTYSFIYKPLVKLVNAFKKVEDGNFKLNIEHSHNDEFRYLYSRFNCMVENLNTLIDQVYKQKILTQKAELKQLQSQINPHFLYNTFFILYSIAQAEGSETVVQLAQRLGNYFQFVTRSAADEVPLSCEIEHAKVYTEIQELRFSNRITIDFGKLPDLYSDKLVPRLIIQPIIENAFEHGLSDKTSDGRLSIRFLQTGDFLHIIIEDNGNGMKNEEIERLINVLDDEEYPGDTTGIINIHRRLQLKYSTGSGLSFLRGEMGGLKVVITINFGGESTYVQSVDC